MIPEHEVTASTLPHQLEESDRLSMLGAFRATGIVLLACALVQLVCIFIPFRLEDAIWTLKNSPKWNGIAPIFLLGSVLFFTPGPNSTRFGTIKLRLTVRILLSLLAIFYLILAGALIKASSTRITQLNGGQNVVMEQRKEFFSQILEQIKTCANRKELDALLPTDTFNLVDTQSLSFDEYRSRIVKKITEMNISTVQSINAEASEKAAETITYFIRKIVRSSTFAFALLFLALFSPRGFPAPVSPNDQPA